MTNFNTELITELSQGINIDEIFRKQLEEAMNLLLETQTTAFLGYEPYDVSAYKNGNSRNGYYHRTFKSEFGELNLNIPRDRQGTFSQKTIYFYKKFKRVYTKNLTLPLKSKKLKNLTNYII